MSFSQLQRACATRTPEWGQSHPSVQFRALEIAGEIGEVQNEIKKIVRGRLGMAGSVFGYEPITDEIGDVVICAALMANGMGMTLKEPTLDVIDDCRKSLLMLNKDDIVTAGLIAEVASGGLCTAVASGNIQSQSAAPMGADGWLEGRVVPVIFMIAEMLGISVWEAVQTKFNKTSDKHGFSTRLELEPKPNAKA